MIMLWCSAVIGFVARVLGKMPVKGFVFINSQTTNATYMWFSILFQFQPFFGHFLSLLERRTNFIKFWTKFWIKQMKLLPSRCTSLLLCIKPVQQNWLRFFKKFKKQCALLGLMKLKLLGETLLLTIFLHQKVTKNQKMTKGLSFKTTRGFLTCLLTLKRRMTHKCGFLYCFSFSHFLATSCRF